MRFTVLSVLCSNGKMLRISKIRKNISTVNAETGSPVSTSNLSTSAHWYIYLTALAAYAPSYPCFGIRLSPSSPRIPAPIQVVLT